MRARTLGIILPDDGPQAYEWHALAPWLAGRGLDDVEVRVAGSACDGLHAVDSLMATGADATLAGPARRLAGEGAEAVVWACTSGSFVGGLAWARAQAAALAEAAGVPASSTALALVDALAELGAARVDLLSPYPADITERLTRFLDTAGVAVAAVRSLDCLRSADSHRLDLRAEVAALPWAPHPLAIPDTAVDSLDLVAAMEDAAGRAVVTANQATLWQGLRLLGRPAELPDAGRLFAGAAGAARAGVA